MYQKMDNVNRLTSDVFGCGICKVQTNSIHDYIYHMMVQEKCSLIMEESSMVKNLLLPRFIHMAESKQMTFNTSREVFPLEKGNLDVELKIDPSALTEIETGFGIRWKCRLCKVTFSRIAAIENHFRLQHDCRRQKDPHAELNNFKSEPDPMKVDYANQPELIDVKPPTNVKKQRIPFMNPICYLCSQEFTTIKSLRAHLNVVHNQKRRFHCKFNGCKDSFKTNGSLKRHQRRHTNVKPYVCSVCNKGFRESGALLRHSKSKICTKSSESQTRHNIESMTDVKPRLKQESASVNHLSNDLNENSANLAAEDSKPCIIQRDKKIDSDIIRTSFTCPVCILQYSKYAQLQDHMKIHTAVVGRECVQCDKKFNTNQGLVRHLQTHSAVREYECPLCLKTFKLKSHAQSHLLSHSNSKEFSCSACQKSFKTSSSRNMHMKIHTGLTPFKCTMCIKAFGVKASLERHKRIHTGEKPFQCPYCHYLFKEHGTLARHLKNKESCASLHKLELKSEDVCEDKQTLHTFSDSELEEFLSEQQELRSVYSEHSQMSFESDDELFGTPDIVNQEKGIHDLV